MNLTTARIVLEDGQARTNNVELNEFIAVQTQNVWDLGPVSLVQ